ncbi:MAG: hypothetical protein ACE5EX_00155 [Phycisphaerae bacterium]
MSQFVNSPTKAFTAGGAIGQYLRVKLTAGKLAIAGLTDKEIGTLEAAAFADGDVRAVRLAAAQGTAKMVAAGAISQGAEVFTAAGGQVSTSAVTGFAVGIALEAAAAAGDLIEVMRHQAPHQVGATFGPSAVTSITVVDGIVTAIA